MKYFSKQLGFTLLEVLVALAVLAIALSAALKAATENTDATVYLRDKTIALWIARNQLTQLQVTNAWPEPGILKGKENMAGREWFWHIQVENTADEQLRRLQVSVYDTAKAKQSIVHLTGFLGLP